MSVFLHSAKIVEGPSPSQFAIAAAEGGSEETIIRLALCEDGEILHEQWGALINFSNARRSIHLDGMYTVQDGHWCVQYDPLRRAGHIVAAGVRAGYDDIIAARRAFFGARLRRFVTVRCATWLR
jgi:hypothetical protein